MRNIHIYPSPFTHESRILKEAKTLSARLGMSDIALVGVPGPGLPETEEISPGIVVHRLGPTKGRGVMKVIRHLLWCVHALWFCLRQRPAIINCHSLPVLPVGVLAKWLTRARLIYDAHELETETLGTTPLRRRIGQLIEGFCMRFVDLLIVVSLGIEEWYRKRYDVKAIVTILNTPYYREATTTSFRFSDALDFDPSKRVLLYQGGLVPGRGLEALVEAAPQLDAAGYILVLMGFGTLEEMLAEKASEGHFYLHPPVKPDELLSFTVAADIGLCLTEDSCLNNHLSLPNKIFEYVMARVPIVASDLPEIRSIVEGSEVGACIRGDDTGSVLETVRRVEKMLGPALKGRLDTVARYHSWEVQETRMCQAYRTYVLPPVAG